MRAERGPDMPLERWVRRLLDVDRWPWWPWAASAVSLALLSVTNLLDPGTGTVVRVASVVCLLLPVPLQLHRALRERRQTRAARAGG